MKVACGSRCWLAAIRDYWRVSVNRRADGGDVARNFPTPKRDAMARSSGRNASYISNTRTATKPKQRSVFANFLVEGNWVSVAWVEGWMPTRFVRLSFC